MLYHVRNRGSCTSMYPMLHHPLFPVRDIPSALTHRCAASCAVKTAFLITIAVKSLLLTGCGSGGSGSSTDSLQDQQATVPDPLITGSPPTSVVAEYAYNFQPTGGAGDARQLSFTVDGLPQWANFDATTGALSGNPGVDDIGVYHGIVVSATDGKTSTVLEPFSIEVLAPSGARGTVALSWQAPAVNVDGTVLTDLIGYRIYWGNHTGEYTHEITIDNPSVTTFVVENLPSGSYEFAVTAVNAKGIESGYSRPVSTVLDP